MLQSETPVVFGIKTSREARGQEGTAGSETGSKSRKLHGEDAVETWDSGGGVNAGEKDNAASVTTCDVHAVGVSAVEIGELIASSIEIGELVASEVRVETRDLYVGTAVTTGDLAERSAVDSGELVASAVKIGEIVASPVEMGEIVASAVEMGEIVESAVEMGEIVASAVEIGELVASEVRVETRDLYVGTAVTTGDLAERSAVDSGELHVVASAVKMGEIVASPVEMGEIVASAVEMGELFASAVEMGEIVASAVENDGVYRGTKLVNLKQISDDAVKICKKRDFIVEKVFVVRHLGSADVSNNGDRSSPVAKRPCYSLTTEYHEGRDLWWHDVMEGASDKCEPVWLEVEEPLFMLYTSGSTGTPKGVVHTQIGYLLYAATTFKYSFDHHKEDIYWCTADIGWITGHSYVCYGPMANAATSVMYEGAPLYPDESRCWQIVDKYNVTILYTAPTLIRTLMKYGEAPVKKYSRKSLRVLATVGEPINPEAWLFYYNVIGDGRCSISDTFWQTETGGHTLTPLPGATPMKPGSATFPFFGIAPAVVNEQGEELEGVCEGYLVFKQPWPGVMRTVYGDHERYERTYFRQFPGYYKTGDGCKRDKDGYYWITGRIDDMFNVSGHLLSTAEIESAIIEHSKVAEAAAVAYRHPTKGEACYCFVTLVEGAEFDDALILELKKQVRTKIGPFAAPEVVHNAPGLPKTRSGKIMRRILRKIAVNDHDLGDVSTMADSTVVDILFKNRPQELLG
ncbi:acetyl-coenzyme A synthetase, cytoplasmic-like [Lytechinus pictus]|uniref:acetyl-coenzyme A synthetase, cytoplasmic-like n=1 Tax=Lytechinus pictus TaxID=7653 RepID=UPI0030BA1B26